MTLGNTEKPNHNCRARTNENRRYISRDIQPDRFSLNANNEIIIYERVSIVLVQCVHDVLHAIINIMPSIGVIPWNWYSTSLLIIANVYHLVRNFLSTELI